MEPLRPEDTGSSECAVAQEIRAVRLTRLRASERWNFTVKWRALHGASPKKTAARKLPFLMTRVEDYTEDFLRVPKPTPASAIPSKASVAGSGILVATNVCVLSEQMPKGLGWIQL